MQIQQRLTAFAMLGATWVLWMLVGLSILGVAIILERAYTFMSTRDDIAELKKQILRFLRRGEVDNAKAELNQSPSFEARVAIAGLDAATEGYASAEERMASETQLCRIQMERNLAFLGTVGNNAPFVGLLGTVIGIIRAFHALNESSGQVSSQLMAEVGEALVATAIGILVALPAVASYNFFQRLIRTRLARADALGRDVLAYLKSKPSTLPGPIAGAEAAE